MKKQLIEWTINEVAPEANRTGDPVGAILKVAKERNLPPAAVERLGHLWNTGRTLNHLEKSANRADDVPIVDVPDMLSKYSGYNSKQDIRGYRAPENKRFPGVDAIFNMESGGTHVLKIASEKDAPRPRMDSRAVMVEIRDYYNCSKYAAEQADALRYDAEVLDCKLVDEYRNLYRGWEFEKEASDLLMVHPEHLGAVQRMGNVLKKAGLIDEVPGVSNELRNGVSFDTLEGWVEKYAKLRETSKYLSKYAGLCVGEIDRLGESCEEVREFAKRASSTLIGSYPYDDVIFQTSGASDSEEAGGPMGQKPKSPKKREGSSASVTGPETPEEYGVGEGVKQLAGDLGGMGSILLNKKISPKTNLEQALVSILEGNKRESGQSTIDEDMVNLQRRTILQDLMITDDVLSESDPEKVEEAYNTIMRFSPELASDRNTLMTLLHTMLAHDGLDPTTAKNLMETQRTQIVKDKETSDAKRRAYMPSQYGGKDSGKSSDKE